MENEKQIKVLVVEGEASARPILMEILRSDPRISVIAVVGNGREAQDMLSAYPADVVLMDLDLPAMDGYETTRRIMETRPVPIVACADGSRGAIAAFQLTEMGAVAGVKKPRSPNQSDFAVLAANLLQTVKLMSEIKVVRRWRRASPSALSADPASGGIQGRRRGKIEVIGIGASTGGPPVLQAILMALPKDFSVPILVVQHIAPGFLPNLVEWLSQTTGYSVQIASDNELVQPCRAYVAPDDRHMAIRADGRIVLSKTSMESGVRPSVSHLFRSIADAYGANAAGVLLTGMGRDGADDLKRMRDRGAFTIAQDRETSVVYGMPGEAVRIGGATLVLPVEKIAPTLMGVASQHFIQGQQTT